MIILNGPVITMKNFYRYAVLKPPKAFVGAQYFATDGKHLYYTVSSGDKICIYRYALPSYTRSKMIIAVKMPSPAVKSIAQYANINGSAYAVIYSMESSTRNPGMILLKFDEEFKTCEQLMTVEVGEYVNDIYHYSQHVYDNIIGTVICGNGDVYEYNITDDKIHVKLHCGGERHIWTITGVYADDKYIYIIRSGWKRDIMRIDRKTSVRDAIDRTDITITNRISDTRYCFETYALSENRPCECPDRSKKSPAECKVVCTEVKIRDILTSHIVDEHKIVNGRINAVRIISGEYVYLTDNGFMDATHKIRGVSKYLKAHRVVSADNGIMICGPTVSCCKRFYVYGLKWRWDVFALQKRKVRERAMFIFMLITRLVDCDKGLAFYIAGLAM